MVRGKNRKLLKGVGGGGGGESLQKPLWKGGCGRRKTAGRVNYKKKYSKGKRGLACVRLAEGGQGNTYGNIGKMIGLLQNEGREVLSLLRKSQDIGV